MDSRTPKKENAQEEAQKTTWGVGLAVGAVLWMLAAVASISIGFIVHSLWSALHAGWILFDMLMKWNP